jgi:hypothetical protein
VRSVVVWYLLIVTMVGAEGRLSKLFGEEYGVIEYTIRGEGVLSERSSISIRGSGHFAFDQWGEEYLHHEEGSLRLHGVVGYQERIKRTFKQIEERRMEVDYAKQQLFEKKEVRGSIYQEGCVEGMRRVGEAEVMGYPCEVWRADGITKYLYSGLLLKKEVEYFGISYIKEAKALYKDANLSAIYRKLPPYPKGEVALFHQKNRGGALFEMSDFCHRVEREAKQGEKREQDREAFVNRIGEEIFQKQKRRLLEWIEILKESRFCLQHVQNHLDANACMEEYRHFSTHFDQEEVRYLVAWSQEEKSAWLEHFEKEILFFQSRRHCIERANHLSDLLDCMGRQR